MVKVKLYLGRIVSNAITELEVNPQDAIDVTVMTEEGDVIDGVLVVNSIIETHKIVSLEEKVGGLKECTEE